MVKLIYNDVFVKRLERIDSPIAEYLLNLTAIDETRKDYINYIGVSVDNPTFISYLDKNKERKNKIVHHKKTKYFPSVNGEVSINKRFFKNVFHRGRWKKNPYFTEISIGDQFTEKEKRRWYKRRFTFNHRAVDYREESHLIRVNIQEIIKHQTPYDTNVGAMQLPLYHNYNFWDDDLREYRRDFVTIGYSQSVYMTFQELNERSPLVFHKKTHVESYDHLWDPEKRLHGNAGKITKRIIGDKFSELFTDADLENFVDIFRKEGLREADSTGEFMFEELSGERIKWGYHHENYYSQCSTLGSSCMRHDVCQDYFGIYTDNPRHVSLAVLLKDEKVAARCLLWYPNTKGQPDEKYYDRRYAINSHAEQTLEVLLEARGYKNIYETYGCDIDFNLDKGFGDFDEYPYMDTFYYINGTHIGNHCGFNYAHKLQDADGYTNSPDYTCADCGSDVDEDEACVSSRGRFAHQVLCDSCAVWIDHNHTYVHVDDAARVETRDGHTWRLRDDCVEDYNGDWILTEDAVTIDVGRYADEYAHIDEVTSDVDGYNYRTSDIENHCMEFKNEWYPHDHEDVVLINCKYYHTDDDDIVLVHMDEHDHEYREKDDEDIIFICSDEEYYHKDHPGIEYVNDEWVLKSEILA